MQTRQIFSGSTVASTSANFYGKLSNFNPNSIVFYLKTTTASTVLQDSDLASAVVSIQFKNRLGKNAVILNNVPLLEIAKLSDFIGGFSINATDVSGAFRLPIGKVILTGQDEINVTVTFDGTVAKAFDIECYGLDEAVGKETINIYEYAIGSAGQQLTFPNAIACFMDIASPSGAVQVRTNDYFDNNLISEIEIVSNGAVLGRSENWDSFGQVWADKSGYSQLLGITCGSSNEKVLCCEWFYDPIRIGVSQSETLSLETYAKEIKDTNEDKYKCLAYLYGL